jgi:hypothetical protein
MNSEDQQQSNRRQGDEQGLTRRRILQVLGTGAAVATLGAKLRDRSASAAPAAALGAPPPLAAPPVALHPVALGAQPFSLTAVRLLDGPFKDAQDRDGRYLLSLDPDRMLHNFRVNAGLVPKAPVYGGWESVETWADIRAHGHTLGHYLTACALMYASTGNDEFKKRCDYIARELEECQTAAKTGLINAALRPRGRAGSPRSCGRAAPGGPRP